jgi:hypothetical protein
MAWETRRGRRYYYQSRRVNGRVVKEYVGGGKLGEIAAWFDQQERDERDVRAERDRAARDEDEALRRQVEDFDREVAAVVAAALVLAGYHRADRKRWRKRRGEGQGAGGDGRPDQSVAAAGEHGRPESPGRPARGL